MKKISYIVIELILHVVTVGIPACHHGNQTTWTLWKKSITRKSLTLKKD